MPRRILRATGAAMLALGAVSTSLVAQDTARATAAGLPVRLGDDTVLTVHQVVPPYTLAQRAREVERRIEEVAGDGAAPLPTLRIAPDTGATIIMADGVALVRVFDGDAAAAGVSRDSLASRWVASLRASLERRTLAGRARALMLGAGKLLAATLAFALLAMLVLRVERRMARKLETWSVDPTISAELQKAKLISPQQVVGAALFALRLLRTVGIALLAYAWLVAAFGAFAWTRPLAGRIAHFVLDPVVGMARALVAYLPSFFFIIVAVVVLRLALRGIHGVFRAIEHGAVTLASFPPEWADPTYKIVRTLVIAFGFILIFPYLPGAGSDAFKAISLFAGALFSLGSSGAVANIVAGAVIVYTRAFRVGDFVRIGETQGMVLERSLLVTRIRTMENVEVSIPSSTVLGAHVHNFSVMASQGGLLLRTRVTIGYDAPWRQVHDLLLSAARCTEGVLAEPAPYVVQEALNDYYPTYCLGVYTDRPGGMDMSRLQSRLHANIQDAFFQAGVEILSPAFTAVRDGNRTAMPSEYLPKGYRAPGWPLETGRG
ncbi:MAG TPA: mechanosensitive ion channel domain-containing protein [Gemmatimonadales bacterium]|nr:mechanosensitive ion channel domain-containing protein [Gemmatimonadales bacterium]